MMRRIAAGLALVALWGCETNPPRETEEQYPAPDLVPTGDVVATIGPVTLTTDELEERIRLQNPLVRARLADPNELERFVEAEVRNELLALVGWEKGLFDDPEVQRALRQAVVRKLMSREVAEIDEKVEVTDQQIVELYKEREDQYFRPERIRVGQLFKPADSVAAKSSIASRFEKLADQIRTKQRKGRRNAFDEVAQQITAETGADRRSIDLGFMTREEAREKFGEAVADRLFDDMTVGDVTVATLDDGVAILAKTGRRGEVRRSLESVKPSLVAQLRADRRGELLKERIREMAEERGISLELENLDKMSVGQATDEGEEAPER